MYLREDRNIFSFILHESIFNNTSYSMQYSIINKKGIKNHENIYQKEIHVNYFGTNDDAKRICNAFG